jgi:protein-tyrosine phosphatase
MEPESFRVLAVCSGNICRSPMAERLLLAGLADVPGVAVSSAGTIAREGLPMEPEAANLTREFGGDPAGHRSRYLTAKVAGSADLVLGMAREHRSRSVSLAPSVVRRAFTIRELARLSSPLSDDELVDLAASTNPASLRDRLGSVLRALGTRRGLTPPVSAEHDDVVDPYGLSDAVWRRSADELVPAVAETVRVIRAVAFSFSPNSSGIGVSHGAW